MARIVVDTREPGHGVPWWLAHLGVETDTHRLAAGDYQVGLRALVERKTVRGLHAALTAGTFWPQIGRFREAADFCYVLVEGTDLDAGPVAPASIRGVCVALLDLGVDVIRSTDCRDSALWLLRIAERRASVRHRSRAPYAQRPKSDAGIEAAEAALSTVPGISTHHARALLAAFGTLESVAQANSTEWQAVGGIGPKRASALESTFRTPLTSSRSRRSRERQGPST